MIRKIALVGYYGAGNLGDELLLQSTVQLLEGTGNFTYLIFSHNPEQTQEIFPGAKVLPKFKLWQVLGGIFECEALVFGGGSIFQNVSSLKSLIYYFGLCLFAKLMGKKLVLLAQGIGPLQGNLASSLAAWAFRMADIVTTRDKRSQSIAEYWGVQSKMAADLVWSLAEPTKNEERKNNILISLRPSPELAEEKLQSFANFLKYRFPESEFSLVAFQESDLKPLAELASLLNLPGAKIYELYDFKAWESEGRKLFANALFSFAMRLHAVVLSLKSATPTFGLAYDPKVESLCHEAGVPFLKISELSEEAFEQALMHFKVSLNHLKEFQVQQTEISTTINGEALCVLVDELE